MSALQCCAPCLPQRAHVLSPNQEDSPCSQIQHHRGPARPHLSPIARLDLTPRNQSPPQHCSGPADTRHRSLGLCLSPCWVSRLVHWSLCEWNPALLLAKPTRLKTLLTWNLVSELQAGGWHHGPCGHILMQPACLRV